MKFRSNFKMLPLAAMVLASMGVAAHAEPWAPTATKSSQLVPSAVHVAAMQVGAPTHIVVALKVRNKAQLDELTANILAGRTTQTLSSAEFMSRHAPSAAQVQSVVAYLTRSGFRNIKVEPNNMLVSADGTAASVKTAFNTEMHVYNVNGRTAHANTGDVFIPQSLSDTILAVHGLQDVQMAHTMLVKAKPNSVHTLTAVGHNPTDFPLIYNASSLPSATNATIGIITSGNMSPTLADLKTFATNSGYPQPNVSVVTLGSASSSTSGEDEWNMDTQDSLAAAGGTIKQMILYTASTLSDADLTTAYNRVVSDNTAKAINVSLGECESDAQSAGTMASNDLIFQSAVAQGQTFSISSGDSGAYECGGSSTAQSYPASSPYVIAVGGSSVNTTGTTTWASETVWACTSASSCQQSANGGAGGGPSLDETAPSWQISAGVLKGATKRGVPDIALDADPNTGAMVLINGQQTQIGGTSLAAPLFAGFWARVQSMNANALAFPAAKMYQLAAANPTMFHDIVSGSNGGYSAAAGWDYASGYGSLNMANFASVMGGTPPPPPGNVLSSGVPVTGLAEATEGSGLYYSIVVPAGKSSLVIKTTGTVGDDDIYVGKNYKPTLNNFDKYSDNYGDNDSVTYRNPAAGTYYVFVEAYQAFSGVTLTATFK
ncbi:protease pro-enzyme activation domain-containing protein [Solimicrobium silvestre]|uniref:Pro-kumamolisin, activation domain n=1 Tax=Solimicrobium silvestre TaxID=2099400 RepID=A0A2S9H306_9BURK|nr:protease pro-enzyme activation domain-containing protein [Solimicrobium silvestre]PRC94361.1 Pro-kumamolisin, activation domain [Solimicrobium silvestre]